MAQSNEQLRDEMLANVTNRVRRERDGLRRKLSGPPPTEGFDLAPRRRAPRKGSGRLYQFFRAWAEELPPEA